MYRFRTASFWYDQMGFARDFNVCGIELHDREFGRHPWLVSIYPDVLSALRSSDPFMIQRPEMEHYEDLAVWLTARDGRRMWLAGRLLHIHSATEITVSITTMSFDL